MLEPKAPASELKIAASAVIVPGSWTGSQALSFSAQHQQNENRWKIDDRGCEQSSRGHT
jgi:hypothetical protein